MAKGYNDASNKKSNSSKPYDASNSFVKKVASRVTGLIPQTGWLSGWFSSPDEVPNLPDTAQNARFSNEDDSSEDQQEQPPPSKRIKLPDRNYGSEMFTPSGCSKDPKISPQGDFMDMSSVPGPSGQQRGPTGFVASTPAEQERKANGDDCSESAESTSGCSSLEPQITRVPGAGGVGGASGSGGPPARANESLPARFLDDRFNYPSYLQSPRSLFLERSSNSRSNQSASRRKPSFSVTSLNSSLFGDRSLNETMVNSPFYSGRTMYGGAAASPYRRSLGSASFTSSASSDKAARHTVKVRPSPAQPSTDTGMSETARRILATLEQFSTPLLDAKRIPVSTSASGAPQPVLASSRKRARQDAEEPRILLNHPRSPQLTRRGVHWAKGPPVKELAVPSTPDTLVLHRKERFSSAADEALVRQRERLQDATTAARRLANSVPASNIGLERIYTLRSEDDDPPSGKRDSLKMKSDLRTNVRQSKTDNKDEPPREVNLPKIALPITSLPSFDIPVAKPAPVTAIHTPTPKTAVATAPATPTATPFTFASPIVVAADHKPISGVAFVFSEPDPVEKAASTPAPAPTLNFLASVPSRDKPGKRKSVTVSENGSDAIALKPPSELRTGSVMDILGKGKSVNGSVSLMDKFKPAAGTWECDQCMIRNKAELTRCAACTSPRAAGAGSGPGPAPGAAAGGKSEPHKAPAPEPAKEKNDSGFGAQFKLTGSGMWECSACMVRNKSDVSACVACSTAKPGAAAAPAKAPTAAAAAGWGSSWGDKFKPASNTWECDACMVRNSAELNACQACTTKRPGAAAAAATSSTSTSNTTLTTTTAGWGDKFKKAEGSWDCSDCMITNKSASLKCVACGAKKPGSKDEKEATSTASPPKFSFGIPAGSVTATSSAATSGAATSGFSFGVPQQQPATESTGFKLGATSSAATTGFTFGIPATASPAAPAAATATASGAASEAAPAAAKPAPTFSFGVPPTATKTDAPAAQEKAPTFSFGQTSSASSEPSRKRKSSAEASQSSEPPKVPSAASTEAAAAPSKASMAPAPSLAAPSLAAPAAKASEPATLAAPKPAPTFAFSAGSPASVFKFGADSNTAAAASPKPAPPASAAAPTAPATDSKLNPEAKSFFGASTTSMKSTFAFGQSSSETKAAVATFGGSDASAAAKPFTFGQASSDAGASKPKEAEPPKPAGGFSLPAKPAFVFGQAASEPAKVAEAPKAPAFGAAATATPDKPAFSFQPSADSTKPLGGFAASTPAASMFGSTNTFSTFGTSSSGSGPAPTPTFGAPASAAAPAASAPAPATLSAPSLSFGAATPMPTFGSSFASSDKAESKPSMFSFGSSSAAKPAAAAPFTFGASAPTANGPTFGAQPAPPKTAPPPFPTFNAAGGSSAPAPTHTFGSFGAGAPAATAPAPAPAQAGAPSLFGAAAPAPAFGAPTQPAFNTNPAPPSQFNFSANSAAAPVFTFGGNAPQNSSPAPFSFSAKAAQAPPAFNPNVTPNFNFSSGGAVNFTATPGESRPPPQRVIKKAMRRTLPR